MALLYTFEDGFEVHGGKLTKKEEADFYRRIGGGPTKILRSSPRYPVEQPEAPAVLPQLQEVQRPS
jgi:hypothetical protein